MSSDIISDYVMATHVMNVKSYFEIDDNDLGILKDLPEAIAHHGQYPENSGFGSRTNLSRAVELFDKIVRKVAREFVTGADGKIESEATKLGRAASQLGQWLHLNFQHAANYDKKHEVALQLTEKKQQIIASFLNDLAQGRKTLGPDQTDALKFLEHVAKTYFKPEVKSILSAANFGGKSYDIKSSQDLAHLTSKASFRGVRDAIREIIHDAEKNLPNEFVNANDEKALSLTDADKKYYDPNTVAHYHVMKI